MPTKYQRETGPFGGATPFHRQQQPVGSQRTYRWVLLFGTLVLMLLLVYGGRIIGDWNNQIPRSQRGEAVVLELREDAGVNSLVLEITHDQSRSVHTCDIPRPFWEQMRAGDRVAVRFTVTANGTVTLLECGFAALPDSPHQRSAE